MYSVHLILQEDERSENEKDNEKGSCKLQYFFVVLLLLSFLPFKLCHLSLIQLCYRYSKSKILGKKKGFFL